MQQRMHKPESTGLTKYCYEGQCAKLDKPCSTLTDEEGHNMMVGCRFEADFSPDWGDRSVDSVQPTGR